MPEKEGDQLQPDDWTPDRINEMLQAVRAASEKEEADPVELVRFGPNLSPEQVAQGKAMLREFPRKLWALSNKDLVQPINVIEHHIHVSNPAPISRRGAPKSKVENEALGEWAAEMVEDGIVGNSTSLNCAPLVIALKKAEAGEKPDVRVCVNFRGRNETTYGDATLCPEILPSLQALGGSSFFGSADGKSAFHQIAMAHGSREYTAFQVRGHGHMEFLRMPFGLKTAPATFIRAMDIVFSAAENLVVFFDDINHGNPTFEGHLDDWRDLFTRALLHNLRLSPKKTLVGFSSVVRLGYRVDETGLHPDPKKVEAILSILPPTDATGVRAFLGMTGFYSPLIPNYSALAGPLHGLTTRGKNVAASWTEEHQHSFEALKQALAATPCIAYPDFAKRFTLTCDWQPGHIAAISESEARAD